MACPERLELPTVLVETKAVRERIVSLAKRVETSCSDPTKLQADNWRRSQDSNMGGTVRPSPLANECHKPLGHFSISLG